jgi:hypothetical protein
MADDFARNGARNAVHGNGQQSPQAEFGGVPLDRLYHRGLHRLRDVVNSGLRTTRNSRGGAFQRIGHSITNMGRKTQRGHGRDAGSGRLRESMDRPLGRLGHGSGKSRDDSSGPFYHCRAGLPRHTGGASRGTCRGILGPALQSLGPRRRR